MKINKKGETGTGMIYSVVMILGMVGILIGVLLQLLGKFSVAMSEATTGSNVTRKAELGLNKTVDAMYDIPNTWLPIVVVVAVAGVVLFIVTRFGANRE